MVSTSRFAEIELPFPSSSLLQRRVCTQHQLNTEDTNDAITKWLNKLQLDKSLCLPSIPSLSRRALSNGELQLLQSEWPRFSSLHVKPRHDVIPDPPTACFYARRTLELVVQLALQELTPALKPPYQDHLDALLHDRLHAPGGRRGLHQGASHQESELAVHSHKPNLQLDSSDGVSRTVPRLLLAGPYLCARGAKPADRCALRSRSCCRPVLPMSIRHAGEACRTLSPR